MPHLATKKQPIRFSRVGTAHQNAVAERAIQTIIYMARTLLNHASLRNPSGTITANHWPMAMDYAAWVYNHMPAKENNLTPNGIWSRSKDPRLKDTLGGTHVWGAPTYVLEPKLQKQGVKIPKWATRSKRGAFMGFSPKHFTLIGLILNLRTHSITPQFHVPLDKGVSPELKEEWLTEGEALARSTAECQEILMSSGSPGANSNEGILPSQLEDSPNSSPQ
eukprot:11596134-Ditylum_brightwellii.AAC.1